MKQDDQKEQVMDNGTLGFLVGAAIGITIAFIFLGEPFKGDKLYECSNAYDTWIAERTGVFKPHFGMTSTQTGFWRDGVLVKVVDNGTYTCHLLPEENM